jgi:hypothetical protein
MSASSRIKKIQLAGLGAFVRNHAGAAGVRFLRHGDATFRALHLRSLGSGHAGSCTGTRPIIRRWEWTIQQLRMVVPGDQSRYVVDDHEAVGRWV